MLRNTMAIHRNALVVRVFAMLRSVMANAVLLQAVAIDALLNAASRNVTGRPLAKGAAPYPLASIAVWELAATSRATYSFRCY